MTSFASPANDRPHAGTSVAPLLALAVVLAVVLLVVRGEPRVWGDSGVWLTVAARLLEGDRLYADVADNKDPLFFYTFAGALWAGGWRGPFLLDGLWLAVAGAFTALTLGELRLGRAAVAAGSLVYPLALTASWYDPGATMLPALALAPVAAWLWLRGRFAESGAAVGVAMLFKLNLGLVAGAPLLALLALRPAGGPRWRAVGDWIAGFSVLLGAGAAVLAARGELRAYLDIIAYNVYYADEGLRTQGSSGGIGGHLAIVREFFLAAGKWQAPAAVAAVLAFALAVAVGWKRDRAFRPLAAMTAVAFMAALVTLALTAIFFAHLQMLAYPAALGAATLVAATGGVCRGRIGAVAAAVCILFALWASLKHEDLSNVSLRTWTAEQASTPGLALEEARVRYFEGVERVPYVVFSRNSEDGHAAFAGDELVLACRWFHQYPFYREEQLRETLDCARRERPMLVLVTQSFYDPMPGQRRWESFVDRAQRFLAARYEIVNEKGMSQVWRRR